MLEVLKSRAEIREKVEQFYMKGKKDLVLSTYNNLLEV
jgi:hypothetical protein